ncbi:MAG: hypothetical protein M3Y83_00965 [Actinomycetota bacterium]|nr:hypothetical protein [Actinomycetota bacterium]
MPRLPFWLFFLLLPGIACTQNYYEAPAPQDAGSGTSDPKPDEPGTDPPTTTDNHTTDHAPTTGVAEDGTVDTGDTSSTGSLPPMTECGNGIVEGDEACDDGFGANQDNLACTSTCQKASCGDGLLQAVLGEVCDHGAANVVIPGYDQCSTACTLGAHCGDGVIQPEAGEECEPSPKQGEVLNCPTMCRYAPRLVFLTSESFTGNLGGLAGADKRCNELAAASLLTGAFRAWLLVDGQTLATRFPEFHGEPTPWNFMSMGNDLLAKNFQQLVSQGPAGPLAYTEKGEALVERPVWTNITAAGLAAGGDCGQWTKEAGTALIGNSGFVPDEGAEAETWHQQRQWTDLSGIKAFCNWSYHLYCIQVSD